MPQSSNQNHNRRRNDKVRFAVENITQNSSRGSTEADAEKY
jgi:hypothetical protein